VGSEEGAFELLPLLLQVIPDKNLSRILENYVFKHQMQTQLRTERELVQGMVETSNGPPPHLFNNVSTDASPVNVDGDLCNRFSDISVSDLAFHQHVVNATVKPNTIRKMNFNITSAGQVIVSYLSFLFVCFSCLLIFFSLPVCMSILTGFFAIVTFTYRSSPSLPPLYHH
jgi:hypothetical protein